MDFLNNFQVVPGFVPVDLSDGANTGDYVNLANYDEVVILFVKDAGTAGDDPTLTLREAKDNAGTDVQDLAIIDEVYVKQDTTLANVGQWSKVTQSAAATYTDATSAEDAAVWAVRVRNEQLSDGYTHIQANVADVGNNEQVGCLLYVLGPARYPDAPENLASAIN